MFEPPFPDEEPDEAMTLLARTLRQMFVALISTGFTEAQAMSLISTQITAAMSQLPQPPQQ